ncbi:MAG: hypothetical protein AAB215_05990 [Planctomycetota bacterium]
MPVRDPSTPANPHASPPLKQALPTALARRLRTPLCLLLRDHFEEFRRIYDDRFAGC